MDGGDGHNGNIDFFNVFLIINFPLIYGGDGDRILMVVAYLTKKRKK